MNLQYTKNERFSIENHSFCVYFNMFWSIM